MKTEDVKPNTKRQRHQDRVTLDQECLERADSWIAQVTSVAKGVTLSRKDIVNWLVKHHGEQLAADELNELKARYFSEVRFLQQAIKELKAARQRGDGITLTEILGAANQTLSPAPNRRRVPRKDSAASSKEAAACDTVDDSHMVNVLE